MDHWFDRLTQPHTRRTALKAGALAGALLVLPARSLPKAWATGTEPCYKPCIDAAAKQWSDTRNGACKAASGSVFFGALWFAMSGQLGPAVAHAFAGYGTAGCLADAELAWHRAIEQCRGSECGDPSKYPGGQAPRPPAPKCTAGEEFACGDTCCNVVNECCPCAKVPSGYTCCAAGRCASCCPS
jgi:hypothetical protein